jgi:hypothetical protein
LNKVGPTGSNSRQIIQGWFITIAIMVIMIIMLPSMNVQVLMPHKVETPYHDNDLIMTPTISPHILILHISPICVKLLKPPKIQIPTPNTSFRIC